MTGACESPMSTGNQKLNGTRTCSLQYKRARDEARSSAYTARIHICIVAALCLFISPSESTSHVQSHTCLSKIPKLNTLATIIDFRSSGMATERLVLQPVEPGDDPIADQMFDILRETLQPDPKVSVDKAVAQIVELIPIKKYHSSELTMFLMTCLEIAEQIPYDHPAMVKLVTIIDLCLNSPILKLNESDKVCIHYNVGIRSHLLKTVAV
nr:hypothetical protein CFP56_31516 [Quercus suber]